MKKLLNFVLESIFIIFLILGSYGFSFGLLRLVFFIFGIHFTLTAFIVFTALFSVSTFFVFIMTKIATICDNKDIKNKERGN